MSCGTFANRSKPAFGMPLPYSAAAAAAAAMAPAEVPPIFANRYFSESATSASG